MTKKTLLLLLLIPILILLIIKFSVSPKAEKVISVSLPKPKLVVGIVVDQMRYDYIFRYWDKLSEGGFKRLVNKGFFCKNTNYNYVPTYTGPGHTSIYTGTFPAVHGIISNDWYDKKSGKTIYCTDDSTVTGVGSSSKAGIMSPKNMLVTTIGDELRLHTIQQSKVIGIALKDRASILPAGHSANAAYWFDGSTGSFISSSHYMKALPAWLNEFNAKRSAVSYLQKGWNTMLPIEAYTESTADNMPYESVPNKKEQPVFPYSYEKQLKENNYEIIKATPYGNSITKDLAIAALKGEQMGKGKFTDMLCISFSSTDYVGHSYGPKSVEIEDTYLRLDLDLQELFNTLDAEAGEGNYLLFLTADHGAAEVPAYLQQQKIPAGLVSESKIEKELKTYLYKEFGDSLVLSISNQQVFINHKVIEKKDLALHLVEKKIAYFLLDIDGIAETYCAEDIKIQSYTGNSFKALLQNGYNFKRSGDVLFRYNVAYFEDYMKKGTTHGAEFSYDTHVPLLFYGWNINAGSTVDPVNITDIAPTICSLLNIPFTNGCSGKPIKAVLDK
ncbi:MAG: alkaline phosphatase family protein [Bacteroidetes bacterium]|jgi:predicted AlkP superfamily pyrophosphatase or phosphodiesterase|nr:alkaline phosphatase family protein [Bacteroidota bacterium]